MTASLEHNVLPPSLRRCTKCGVEGAGQYCAACGANLGRPRDLSFKHFIREAFVAVTDVDSAFVASFRSLVLRPGELTREYLSGERQRFMPPFRVFLLCNLLYFVAVAQYGVSVLTVPLRVQVEQMVYAPVTRMVMNKRLHVEAPAMTLEQGAQRDSAKTAFAARYDGATEGIGKAIVFILIPMYALVFQALYAGERRYYAEHVILSTHVMAFLLLTMAAIGIAAGLSLGMMHRLAIGGSTSETDEVLFSAFLLSAFSVYAYRAQRVVYGSTRAGAAIRTIVLTAAVAPMLVVFKFVLFFVTLYWIG